MSQRRKIAWQKAVAVGWLAASGAAFPLFATAQQNAQQPVPSGAALEVGGVQARPAGVQGAQTGPVAVEGIRTAPVAVRGGQTEPVPVEGVQTRPAAAPEGQTAPVVVEGVRSRPLEASGAQSRPIVLPNTGRGEASDDQPWIFFLAGLTSLAAGTYLRWRASRTRVGS